MAIFHLCVQSISRAKGRSATAAAAYRAGAAITDERTGERFDYARKRGVIHTGLVGWDRSRAELWNAAERAERRRDAVVAREVVVALPNELPPDAQRACVAAFALYLRAEHGVAIDYAIHAPDPRGDARNVHAHLLITSRTVQDHQFGQKTRELDMKPSSRHRIEAWRATWAELCNAALERHGIEARVDHRSHRRQAKATGLPELLPQLKLGAATTHLARRGTYTRRWRENQRRQLVNAPILAWRAEAKRLTALLVGLAAGEEPRHVRDRGRASALD